MISDELNHNCIINAVRLSQPAEKRIYRHLDMDELEQSLAASRACRRAIVVTDGIFSMRGDHAPLDGSWSWPQVRRGFAENVLVMVDDSHGVGAFGASGRGTEEHTACAAGRRPRGHSGQGLRGQRRLRRRQRAVIDYLRETSPFYIYSNPITPGEAAPPPRSRRHRRQPRRPGPARPPAAMTARFDAGLTRSASRPSPASIPWCR